MSKKNILVAADRLTVYAIERQAGFERHQPPGAKPWSEQRRFWVDAILQGMARLEGMTPDPQLMEDFDRRLEAARGCSASEHIPPREQAVLIRDLKQYVAALEAAGGDRRQQIAVVGELLDDMATHLSWGTEDNGLSSVRGYVEDTLLRMTAQAPIRFTRILLGGERGPCESGFASGAVMDAEAVKNTGLYKRMSQQYPEVREWPAICTVYVGGGLDSAMGTRNADDFDLSIIRQAGDGFLKRSHIRPVGAVEIQIPACEMLRALKVEPGKAPEAVSIPNTLKSFQTAVGGYIEALGLDDGVCLICNEEGKLTGLPANRRVGGDIIAGTFLIVGEADGEFCSLPDEDISYYAEQFAQPLMSCGDSAEPTQWEFHVF